MSMSIQLVTPRSERFQDIRALRSTFIGNNPAGESEYEYLDSLRDACSYHIAYLDGDRTVGAIRISPIGHGMTFVERMVDVGNFFDRPLDTFDANRLVLGELYRGGKHVHNFLMHVSHWLLTNTNFRHISALCRGKLTALYVGIGGQVIKENIVWQENETSRLYNLVSLDLENVYFTTKGKLNNG